MSLWRWEKGPQEATSEPRNGDKTPRGKIATESGANMVIANADDVEVMWRILKGEEIETLFKANKSSEFALLDYIQSIHA